MFYIVSAAGSEAATAYTVYSTPSASVSVRAVLITPALLMHCKP